MAGVRSSGRQGSLSFPGCRSDCGMGNVNVSPAVAVTVDPALLLGALCTKNSTTVHSTSLRCTPLHCTSWRLTMPWPLPAKIVRQRQVLLTESPDRPCCRLGGYSLVKLVEKERRNAASTKRFKYAGAIDVSKCYPNSGSLDDCALLRPVGEYCGYFMVCCGSTAVFY